jgi:hypothetical protein
MMTGSGVYQRYDRQVMKRKDSGRGSGGMSSTNRIAENANKHRVCLQDAQLFSKQLPLSEPAAHQVALTTCYPATKDPFLRALRRIFIKMCAAVQLSSLQLLAYL